MNGRQYGGGAVVNPGARLDDGRFDIVVFEKGSAPGDPARRTAALLGGIERSRRYRHIRPTGPCSRAETPIEHHRDGEPEPGARRLEIGLLPRALPLLVPRATAEDPTGPFSPDHS